MQPSKTQNKVRWKSWDFNSVKVDFSKMWVHITVPQGRMREKERGVGEKKRSHFNMFKDTKMSLPCTLNRSDCIFSMCGYGWLGLSTISLISPDSCPFYLKITVMIRVGSWQKLSLQTSTISWSISCFSCSLSDKRLAFMVFKYVSVISPWPLCHSYSRICLQVFLASNPSL